LLLHPTVPGSACVHWSIPHSLLCSLFIAADCFTCSSWCSSLQIASPVLFVIHCCRLHYLFCVVFMAETTDAMAPIM
jgi:hypothetical protein